MNRYAAIRRRATTPALNTRAALLVRATFPGQFFSVVRSIRQIQGCSARTGVARAAKMIRAVNRAVKGQ